MRVFEEGLKHRDEVRRKKAQLKALKNQLASDRNDFSPEEQTALEARVEALQATIAAWYEDALNKVRTMINFTSTCCCSCVCVCGGFVFVTLCVWLCVWLHVCT
jgi:hypothetical protein